MRQDTYISLSAKENTASGNTKRNLISVRSYADSVRSEMNAMFNELAGEQGEAADGDNIVSDKSTI